MNIEDYEHEVDRIEFNDLVKAYNDLIDDYEYVVNIVKIQPIVFTVIGFLLGYFIGSIIN